MAHNVSSEYNAREVGFLQDQSVALSHLADLDEIQFDRSIAEQALILFPYELYPFLYFMTQFHPVTP